jgi:hypothetical protein
MRAIVMIIMDVIGKQPLQVTFVKTSGSSSDDVAAGFCSQGKRLLNGREPCRSGGTGKAEAAKPPGAGISPKQCPRK